MDTLYAMKVFALVLGVALIFSAIVVYLIGSHEFTDDGNWQEVAEKHAKLCKLFVTNGFWCLVAAGIAEIGLRSLTAI